MTQISLDVIHNDWGKLSEQLLKLQYRVPVAGENWARACVQTFNNKYRDNLQTQGRTGGEPPPLSSMTLYLYSRNGSPDGSGLRDHINLRYKKLRGGYVATLGITAGKPTIVAKVQNHGAIIPVTEKMRRYLASQGIFLRESTTHIHVPGRRSWDKAWQETKTEAKTTLSQLWQQILS